MTHHQNDRIRTLLRQALAPIGEDREPARDLWPELQSRIQPASATARAIPAQTLVIPWFDWVLAGGVALVAVAFPASIPVLLYYL